MNQHLHHFNIPLEGEPHARRCACGERQRYNPPTGSGFKFTDVLVDEEDLRAVVGLLHYYDQHGGYLATSEQEAALERVEALLDNG